MCEEGGRCARGGRGGREGGVREGGGCDSCCMRAGLLSPLDCPHHMRQDKESPYREGVVLDTVELDTVECAGTLVNCGLKQV